MSKIKQTQKGFTLVEILIVIALMAILAMAALMSSYKTQRYFAFLNTYKEVFQNLRLPRTYSVTNKTISFGSEGKIPAAYSVELKDANPLTKYTVTVFGDNPDAGTINQYDANDVVIGIPYEIPADRFEIKSCDQSMTCSAFSNLTISYIPNEMKVMISPLTTEKFIILRLRDKIYDIGKYIVIFTKSGIVEAIEPEQYGIIQPNAQP